MVFLRAVNVGGTGKLPMAQLREICAGAGCQDVATYIQSGNVVLSSDLDETGLRGVLEDAIAERAGITPEVMVRTATEMAEVVASLPYPGVDPEAASTSASSTNHRARPGWRRWSRIRDAARGCHRGGA